jgi:hypothetical protein
MTNKNDRIYFRFGQNQKGCEIYVATGCFLLAVFTVAIILIITAVSF